MKKTFKKAVSLCLRFKYNRINNRKETQYGLLVFLSLSLSLSLSLTHPQIETHMNQSENTNLRRSITVMLTYLFSAAFLC